MFLRNWYKAAAAVFSNKTVNYTNIYGSSPRGISVGYSDFLSYGLKKDIYTCASLYYVRTAYDSDGGVVFGTGTTPPTIDDYCLAGDLITGISSVASVSTTHDANGATTVALYTVTNNNSEAITIGEIGLIADLSHGSMQADYKGFIERTVLDAPITIPAGGVGQVTYTIRMNYPSA